MGAGSVNGILECGINRKEDKKLRNKRELVNTGIHGDETVSELFTSFWYYYSYFSMDYTLLPEKNSIGQHNSNSFARGLLNSVGIHPSKPSYNLPGWDQPLDAVYFGQ